MLMAGSDEVTRVASGLASAATAVTFTLIGSTRAGRPAALRLRPDAWSAQRLKDTLSARLRGQRVLVVANREPIIHEWEGNKVVVRHPASGLVTALEPVLRACSGVWVAHGGGSADREAADRDGRVSVAADKTAYSLRRVWLTPEEESGYYYGFANEAVWPLCHLAHAQPIFRRDDWNHYRLVNERFADAVSAEVDNDEPIVMVQDYHFALVPRMLRQRFPRATILTFWHIPWPNAERFAICPYQDDLLDGLLGSSILGFQTASHCHNFLESVDRSLEARIKRDESAVLYQGQTTAVRAYPISIEWPSRWAADAPDAAGCRRQLSAQLDFPAESRLIVSVDRLDYTKGIEERLQSFERVLDAWQDPRPLTILQVAAPSRTQIDRYREFGDRVRALVERINARFADRADGPAAPKRSREGGPIRLLDRHCEPPEIFRFYRAADVCYVSSLDDGMNLVAKEFVSARDEERGVLMLSCFAGAARELAGAMVVNPYDIDGVADTLMAALHMSPEEQRDRMRAMRHQVAGHNVYRWAGRMLIDASELRDHDRMRRRFGH
jgi:trehalose 6-phosphate synthase